MHYLSSMQAKDRYGAPPFGAHQSWLAGLRFIEEPVEPPYVKDYDEEKGEGPTRWAKRWDLSGWGLIAAFDGDQRVGGVAFSLHKFVQGRGDVYMAPPPNQFASSRA